MLEWRRSIWCTFVIFSCISALAGCLPQVWIVDEEFSVLRPSSRRESFANNFHSLTFFGNFSVVWLITVDSFSIALLIRTTKYSTITKYLEPIFTALYFSAVKTDWKFSIVFRGKVLPETFSSHLSGRAGVRCHIGPGESRNLSRTISFSFVRLGTSEHGHYRTMEDGQR